MLRDYSLLRPDWLALFCQPIVPLLAGGYEAPTYEVLCRIRDAAGVFHTPERLFAEAERDGFVGALDRIVLERVFGAIAANPTQTRGHRFHVNISGRTIQEGDDFYIWLKDLAVRTGVSPHQIVLELTESVSIQEFDVVYQTCSHWIGLGGQISLDDFGAGCLTIRHMLGLPVQIIKLDRSLVELYSHDVRYRFFIHTLVILAKRSGQNVVAEGATKDIWSSLAAIGVDSVQSFAAGPPVLWHDVPSR